MIKKLNLRRSRRCRHCGCTEENACVSDGVPCHWVSADCCSDPKCLRAGVLSPRGDYLAGVDL